ncbi:Arrestin-like, N-terminal [Penicillium expansum]|uniref:Arrestin-like, N-terminal n=1 Tax=Penicillium expansum TaxID=27334 RepID=A0A0A2JNK6_PENEN|nr:Arrestin-like, N-terminal [Penicillium expansum]KGO53855.1 Arrestin-like, N-terminal [Penicillium expansum]
MHSTGLQLHAIHTARLPRPSLDPRLEDHGKVIVDEYSIIRDKYAAPKYPVVLAHGLLGFDELRLAGPYLPGVQYWRGIKEALTARGIEVITATVPPSSSIEARAEQLARNIEAGAQGKDVNIIAHSMGGLDSRYMISHIRPEKFKVVSLTTIASPHRGSSVADYVFDQIGADRLPQIYYALNRLKVETGAFSQLTRKYMTETFNPNTPDMDDVRYFSYGAAVEPSIWSAFRLSHRVLAEIEGPNDGLVSVSSSRWGGDAGYKGTLMGVSHLDLINWTNRLKWLVGEVTGNKRKFNAIAFYLDIAATALPPLILRSPPTNRESPARARAPAAMSANIVLDCRHTHYTNLDFLKGKVVLQLPTEAAIGAIQVKLECESRTRLSGPKNPQNVHSEKKRTELEVHKILYKVATVFPTPGVMQNGSPAPTYTFAAGSYEYPFEFKFPFNNSCSTTNSMLTNLKFSGLKVEVAKDTNRHVRKTLPPSLSGFPGVADIKYFVKATVIRPQFYKENIRSIVPLNFLPIEPPRVGNPNEETYARRQHQFSKIQIPYKKKSIFSRGSSAPAPPESYAEPPRVSVDARLPNPSILTCNEPVPLRLIAKRLTEGPDLIFLQMLQVELISFTKILAHDLNRTEINSWVIMSRSNMDVPLGSPEDPVGTDWTIDPTLWNRYPLPNSVAPSFETCNIERSYELEIRLGLTYGTQPQLIVLPLRMPVRVFSGIAPPQALLDAMAAASLQPSSSKMKPQPSLPTEVGNNRPPIPPRPNGEPVPVNSGDAYDDAPPSYEDTMGDHLSPVDGPRREYHPPDASSQSTVESGADSKSAAQPGKALEDGPVAGGSSSSAPRRGNRDSTESFDMLPTTPPESQYGSPPASPARRPASMMKLPRNTVDEESPPQYEPVAENQLNASQAVQRQPSRNNLRPMNLGVPNRKPVPRGRNP